jgi:hypothetical protein
MRRSARARNAQDAAALVTEVVERGNLREVVVLDA